jgi:hypothetical protein
MRALRGSIPRAFANHRGRKGYEYGRHVRAKLARLGALPIDAEPVLREWGLLVVDLSPAGDLTKRERRLARKQLIALERRLEAMARGSGDGRNGHRPPSRLDEIRARYDRPAEASR